MVKSTILQDVCRTQVSDSHGRKDSKKELLLNLANLMLNPPHNDFNSMLIIELLLNHSRSPRRKDYRVLGFSASERHVPLRRGEQRRLKHYQDDPNSLQ